MERITEASRLFWIVNNTPQLVVKEKDHIKQTSWVQIPELQN